MKKGIACLLVTMMLCSPMFVLAELVTHRSTAPEGDFSITTNRYDISEIEAMRISDDMKAYSPNSLANVVTNTAYAEMNLSSTKLLRAWHIYSVADPTIGEWKFTADGKDIPFDEFVRLWAAAAKDPRCHVGCYSISDGWNGSYDCANTKAFWAANGPAATARVVSNVPTWEDADKAYGYLKTTIKIHLTQGLDDKDPKKYTMGEYVENKIVDEIFKMLLGVMLEEQDAETDGKYTKAVWNVIKAVEALLKEDYATAAIKTLSALKIEAEIVEGIIEETTWHNNRFKQQLSGHIENIEDRVSYACEMGFKDGLNGTNIYSQYMLVSRDAALKSKKMAMDNVIAMENLNWYNPLNWSKQSKLRMAINEIEDVDLYAIYLDAKKLGEETRAMSYSLRP